jgi:threonine/homoserine/homoserine lactone efflux protein
MPGPNTLYIIARSVQQGRVAGIVSSLGVQTGTWFHVAAAVFGVSAILQTSAMAFSIVKYAGAAYLVYLGVKTLLGTKEKFKTEGNKQDNWSRMFYQGVVVQLLNPKTALFFFAFLPQFVDLEKGAASAQIVLFGGILVVLGATSDLIYALLAGSVGYFLRENLSFLRGQRYFAGSVYMGLGLAAALTGPNRK